MQIKFRHTIAIVPALIFWLVSMLFFIIGLAINGPEFSILGLDPQVIADVIAVTAGLLAIANTVVQVIGWDSSPEEISWILYVIWIASYGLGIVSNYIAIRYIFQIKSNVLEFLVGVFLGTMIEVSPERLFVLAWRSISPKNGSPFFNFRKNNKYPKNSTPAFASGPAYRPAPRVKGPYPNGMSHREYLEYLALTEEEKRNPTDRTTDNRPHWADMSEEA